MNRPKSPKTPTTPKEGIWDKFSTLGRKKKVKEGTLSIADAEITRVDVIFCNFRSEDLKTFHIWKEMRKKTFRLCAI